MDNALTDHPIITMMGCLCVAGRHRGRLILVLIRSEDMKRKMLFVMIGVVALLVMLEAVEMVRFDKWHCANSSLDPVPGHRAAQLRELC